MNQKICDIETGLPEDIIERIEKFCPFDPDNVKGIQDNWKPETKEKKIEEARATHIPDTMKKAQLDPALSFMCSLGWLNMEDGENKIVLCMNPEEEAAALEEFFAMLSDPKNYIILIGFYIENFDMEYMWRRAWQHRIKPPVRYRKGRYWNPERVIDLKDVWTFNNRSNPWPSLERIVRLLDIEYEHRPAGVEGQNFWHLISSGDKEDRQRGIQYAFGDLVEEKRLAQIIL